MHRWLQDVLAPFLQVFGRILVESTKTLGHFPLGRKVDRLNIDEEPRTCVLVRDVPVKTPDSSTMAEEFA